MDDSDSELTAPVNETKKTKRRRQNTADDTSSTAPTKKRKTGQASHSVADNTTVESAGSLYEAIRGASPAITTIVDDWIDRYNMDREMGLIELYQFFISCSGCKGVLTPEMYASLEHGEIIRRVTEEFDEDSGDYPLIMGGIQWKKFRQNYGEFVLVLIRQCQYNIIYDQFMIDNLIGFLASLSDSQVRAFRHTSTLAAMKLMTALVDVALNVSINLDNTQRQYDSERSKHHSKRAEDRLESLLTKRKELEGNQEEIRNMLTYIFKCVFVHRYRDIQESIRALCMSEIGIWMKRYPNMFLEDSFLKYVGWTLYDRVGDVRLCCLKALQPLFETEELVRRMELFTSRFKVRIVEMTLDREPDVAVQAIKLCTSVLKFNDSILTDKECENIYEIVYSSHRQMAQAAGEFVHLKLFRREEDVSRVVAKPRKSKHTPEDTRAENLTLIKDLVQFFIESELHEHGAYLVDSLWDTSDMLRDWGCMTDLLLESSSEALDDQQESSLIEIMVCCVRQAATGECPVGRGTNRKLTAREQKQVQQDKTLLTEHFIVALPQLLAKYKVDDEKVANLLNVPRYFDLEIYTASRQEKNLEALLKHLEDIVDKHTESEVLEACSRCLACFCHEELGIAAKCDVARSTIVDRLVDQRLKPAMQDYFQEGDNPGNEATFALAGALKRLYAFYMCHDLNSWNLWGPMLSIVRSGFESQQISKEIVVKALCCCHQALTWYLEKLDDNNPDKTQMDALKAKVDEFIDRCDDLMKHSQRYVCEEAYITMCDILLLFSRNQARSNPHRLPIVYEPKRHIEVNIINFLNECVFVEEEASSTDSADDDVDENQKIEELHKRRNLLASFCKLIVYGVINMRCAVPVFKHYIRFFNDFGDIIKKMLSMAREVNKMAAAKALMVALTQTFNDYRDDQPDRIINTKDPSFGAVRDLGRRYALSFGLDQVKHRDAVAEMHREGIVFSVFKPPDAPPSSIPPNIGFLEVMTEFTGKLIRLDKRTVLAHLDKCTKNLNPVRTNEAWHAFYIYRNSLLAGIGDDDDAASVRTAASRRPARRRKVPLEMHGSDTPLVPGQPAHQSTAARTARRNRPATTQRPAQRSEHEGQELEGADTEGTSESEADQDNSTASSLVSGASYLGPVRGTRKSSRAEIILN